MAKKNGNGKPKIVIENIVVLVRCNGPFDLKVVPISECGEDVILDENAGSCKICGVPFAIGGVRYTRHGVIGVFDRTNHDHLNAMIFLGQEVIRSPSSFTQ